ncbi:hypothetical protein BBO99_00009789 [Phytophthora kernoviae]|uniref:WRKY19-like zinc finger domain-containing protein n=2 Tax=Phytophthora kernoviae TaxID=325452 RepID=A0A421ETM2_9STRA|nr:hypothetical protein G195_011604 [Phytophthora kernoviae 00238/432]KAG2502571.1 hypothetical protein JM16_009748 [Phytophthora kernoviae]RLM97632.1 hypothetical protein BBI17_009845 [Phytophthora kernoviae]RLN72586.1 hypothetical protein BBO99_00009789 [Phytophthora kernoviae]
MAVEALKLTLINMPASSTRRNANRARCQFAACDKFAQTRGLCKAHGGGSRCRDPQCNKLAQSRGLCIAHGGGRRCQFDECKKLAQSKGYCISHGGGRRCTIPNCEKFSQVKGRCKSHSKLLMSPTHGVMTPPSSSGTSPISPTNTKLSIDFLVNPLSRSSSVGDKQPMMQSQVPSLRPISQLANPFTSAAMGCHPRYDTQVLGNQRSLLSFLEPHGAVPSYPAPQPQYAPVKSEYTAVPVIFQAPMLPSLALYR